MELLRFPSRRGFSVRSILTFALTVVITALLWATFSSSPSQAVREGETATWQNGGNTLIFDRHAYNPTTQLSDTSGTIPTGATVYQSSVQNDTASVDKKVFVIYFTSGVDPPSATNATYVEFTYNSNGSVSNPQNKLDIPVELPNPDGESGSSCSVTGIGWVVCPVSIFLANAMDELFTILTRFIAVQPSVLGDPNNSMYIAWNVMRNIANIAFVIAFLVIIYSQLTNIGVSNYGLKKLIPRLIIAAVLVNISFYIAALAIDVSNILGYSIQDVFNTIREQTFHLTNDNVSGLNTNVWGSVMGIVLAGGGLVGGVYYMASGGLYLLLALVVGLALTLLFVVVILAARQAIIIILVIIAPLAFVANLLPNTEKWFDKWKDLFFTMLIFFPAFSLVFGGSQLAGQIIIQNAGGDIVTLIFGLAVQVAPLVITPLILKLSGSLLGRIAQIANNPRKGLIDRTRNWGERRAELAKQQNMKRGMFYENENGKRRFNPTALGAGMVKYADKRKRLVSDRTDMWKLANDNDYHKSKQHEKIHTQTFEFEQDKQIIDTEHKRHIQDKINTPNNRLHLQNARLEAGKRVLEQTVKLTDATTKEYDAGHIPVGSSPELQASIRQMAAARQEGAIQGVRLSKAEGQIQRDFAEALKASPSLRTRAGGIQPLGADSVLASAVSSVQRADAEDIKNIQDASELKPGDLDGAVRELQQAITSGNTIRARAYQNMLVTSGGIGMNKFRDAMSGVSNVPTPVSEALRENLLLHHAGLKAKSNDLIEWAAKGGTLESHTSSSGVWSKLSDKDFIAQHPFSQNHALDTQPFDKARAQRILEADLIEGNVLTEPVKARLRSIL